MVSLVKLSEVTEAGVKFQSPHDQSEMLLTPEKSIEIQNVIGEISSYRKVELIRFVGGIRCGYYYAIGRCRFQYDQRSSGGRSHVEVCLVDLFILISNE